MYKIPASLLVFLSAFLFVGHARERPNIILFLADDLGWTGLGCFGSDYYETPNLDQLATEGIKFTNAYAACTVCSPTRGAIMTGKYPARTRLTDFISGQNRPYAKMNRPADWIKGLDPKHVTMAEALKEQGYRTGQVGKWHLDFPGDPVGPKAHGFDYAVDKPKGSKGYMIPKAAPGEPNYVTDYLTDRAVEFIEKDTTRPFFLYFAYHVPHTPIQGRPDLVQYFKAKHNPDLVHHNPEYAAMVKSMDMSVGEVMQCLKRHKLDRNTLVVFTSDNGGLTQRYGKHDDFTENIPLRRGKGSSFEGGVRVPGIAWWPGVVPAAKICDTPIISMDFYPTFLSAVGASSNELLDGMDLIPLFKNPEQKLERDFFWHYPHYHAGGDWPYSSIRSGDYRLIESLEDGSLQLYHIKSDLSEKHNLARQMPEKARELRMALQKWRDSVKAQYPSVNPNYDPKRASEVEKQRRK